MAHGRPSIFECVHHQYLTMQQLTTRRDTKCPATSRVLTLEENAVMHHLGCKVVPTPVDPDGRNIMPFFCHGYQYNPSFWTVDCMLKIFLSREAMSWQWWESKWMVLVITCQLMGYMSESHPCGTGMGRNLDPWVCTNCPIRAPWQLFLD